MCLVAIAIGAHSKLPFVCISNRDEFHNRPTEPLGPREGWGDCITYAGLDIQGGGTWLAISERGDFALLTNVRNPALNKPASAPSRGLLVKAAIEGQLGQLDNWQDYSGFNLVHGQATQHRLTVLTNQWMTGSTREPHSTALHGPIHGLSNAHIDADWPKTMALKTRLQQQLAQLQGDEPDETIETGFLNLLADTSTAIDAELPCTGVPYEWEKRLSAIKIESPLYGTRSSTVVWMSETGKISISEVSFGTAGQKTGIRRYSFYTS
ncbi:NRDE family protein [Limnobacter humi]|uniref:NRDE family protein n=1 Tax=Limnobacter humi TaxID=1778671 RepID=A0ABT1WEK3_9BURK|nr:NRDE family protein [Limnobacter humi]MCQ8895947.1 NRDE family protein [Limnobacter humi]